MKKILATCYAVNPYKGSEDGTAWNMLCQIAKDHRVVAITRKNNRPDIERYFRENEFPGKANLQFRYFDWPYYLRFWKRKNRGALLYFYLWQMTIVRFIRKEKIDFDIAHNLNFHNDWTPTFLWRLGQPVVWGPVGHHPDYPATFIKTVYGWPSYALHRIKHWTKTFFWRCDPFLKIAQKKVHKIVAINSSVAKVWPHCASKTVRLPAVGAAFSNHSSTTSSDTFEVLSVGRFVPLKGFDLTIKAFAQWYHDLPESLRTKVKLTLIGKGPQKALLEKIIHEEGIASAVELIDWIEQKQLMDIYQRASVFCFPSHEGAGMVIPEALAAGLPVLCLDNSGPGEFINATCGRKVTYGDYDRTVKDLGDRLKEFFIHADLLQSLAAGARQQHAQYFTWEYKGHFFRMLYEEVLTQSLKKKKHPSKPLSPTAKPS